MFIWLLKGNFKKQIPSRNVLYYYDNITTFYYYPISSLYLSSGCSREVENKRKFQTFSSKSGHGHLCEVVAYEKFHI